MSKKYFILLFITIFVVAIDQITKLYFHTRFELGESIVVIPNYLNFTYVRNFGAAFGMFNDSPETFRHLFFLSIPAIAVGMIIYFIYSLPESEKLQIIALSMICGGAIGNYIDRIQYGYVVDFLDVHIQNKYSWPVFNIADSAIVVGVTLLSVLMLIELRNEWRKKNHGKVSSIASSHQRQ